MKNTSKFPRISPRIAIAPPHRVASLAWFACAWGLVNALASLTAQAEPLANPPDTSTWTCSQCPFLVGATGQAELGTVAVKGANASYGRYTGEDRSGGYVDAQAQGQARSAAGDYLSFDLQRLGLPSRDAALTAGHEGRYELTVRYDGQPDRISDTAVTPFAGSSGGLHLPSGWVPGATTTGMSALAGSLAPINLGTERRAVALDARYRPAAGWTIFGAIRHEEKVGMVANAASFLTQSVQFAQPLDTVTNTLEAGVAWAGKHTSARLSYSGSWFENSANGLRFDNPYVPLVAGSTQGQIGLPPANTLQQLAGSTQLQLPWRSTTLTVSASLGTLRQNAAFVPVSTLPGTPAPLPASLQGDVRLSHYAVSLASAPLAGLIAHASARFDGREDHTAPQTVNTVVNDTFSGGAVVTPRYGQNRSNLEGGADYALRPWLRAGVGGSFREVRYAPGQVLDHSDEVESWGRVSAVPGDGITLGLKVGNGLRKVSGLNLAALPPAENPQVRAFNTAPRDRSFATVSGSWAVSAALALAVESTLANDDYRKSTLGLQSVHERSSSASLTWTASEALSGTVDAAYQSRYALQSGAGGSPGPGWLLADRERYWNLGAGGRWTHARWLFALDYRYAPSSSNSDAVQGGPNEPFPQNTTRLESAALNVSYRCSAALQWHLRMAHESYHSSDWALDGVGPQTIPNLLALGVQSPHDSVNLLGLSIRYQIGATGIAK